MKIAGVILAGGRASRMGGADKALVPLGGRPMLVHVIHRLAPQVETLALNANGDPARLAPFALPILPDPVLPDPVPHQPGPLAGLLAGMRWGALAGATHIVTAATDTPFLPGDLVARLRTAAAHDRAPIALAETEGGLHPTFGLWPVTLADDLAQALEAGARRVGAWALGEGATRARFTDHPFDPFFNVNTPADLEAAERIIARLPK